MRLFRFIVLVADTQARSAIGKVQENEPLLDGFWHIPYDAQSNQNGSAAASSRHASLPYAIEPILPGHSKARHFSGAGLRRTLPSSASETPVRSS